MRCCDHLARPCIFQEAPIQIILGYLTGRSIPMEVFPSYTVARVKRQFYDQEGVPPRQQRYIYGRKAMEDDKMLSNYGVQDQSRIMISLHLVGGKPVILLYPPCPLDTSVHLSLNCGWKILALYPTPSRKIMGSSDDMPVSTTVKRYLVIFVLCL